jgi:hypothetical protein
MIVLRHNFTENRNFAEEGGFAEKKRVDRQPIDRKAYRIGFASLGTPKGRG